MAENHLVAKYAKRDAREVGGECMSPKDCIVVGVFLATSIYIVWNVFLEESTSCICIIISIAFLMS